MFSLAKRVLCSLESDHVFFISMACISYLFLVIGFIALIGSFLNGVF